MKLWRSISSVLLTLALLLGVGLPVAAQQTGGLQGTVYDFEGKPLPGVTVEFLRTDINQRFQVKTDKKGHYLHAGLPAGGRTRYTIRILREGQQLFKLDNVNVRIGEIRELDINLKQERERMLAGQGMTEEQKKRLEEFRKQQEEAQSLKEHFELGLQLAREKQYEQAISEFEAAAEIDPEQYAVYANLGRAYAAVNQSEKAIEAYQRALELNPEEAGVYNNLGQVYVNLRRFDEARQAFEKAAELSPADAATFYFNLGVTFYNANQLPAAIEPLRKATEVDPDRADAHYLLGVCLLSTAESKIEADEIKMLLKPGTRESFERYLELAPNGKFAEQAKANLQAIAATVPARVEVDKKKK